MCMCARVLNMKTFLLLKVNEMRIYSGKTLQHDVPFPPHHDDRTSHPEKKQRYLKPSQIQYSVLQ